jgi:hypothetical protein
VEAFARKAIGEKENSYRYDSTLSVAIAKSQHAVIFKLSRERRSTGPLLSSMQQGTYCSRLCGAVVD